MPTITSAFDPVSWQWRLSWPERITQHDLVYLSPPGDPMQGIPLGNGDVGVLMWCEPSRVVFALNKCDLWDDAPFERLRNWFSAEEERTTALRHAGRLVLDLGVPLLDPFYLQEFEARLDLAAARAHVAATTCFGRFELSAFVCAEENALVIECESELDERVAHELLFERWGSRTYSHWYAKVRRDPTVGLAGTEVAVAGDESVLTQDLTSGRFAVGCRVVPHTDETLTLKKLHSRAARYAIESASPRKKWSALLTFTSPLAQDAAAPAAKAMLTDLEAAGLDKLRADHEAHWKEFWERSYVHIADDYLENHWHLAIYYINCSCGGAYPGTFVNGLWGWNRDVHPWNYYFHWNQQMAYWCLPAAGHADRMLPYLEFRYNSLPHAIADARDWFGVDGAFISDVADRRGCNDEHTKDNHTPVAQIAMDFWRYFRFSGDRTFLQERAFPFMLKAAGFFESLFEKREDGVYHAKCGLCYEGYQLHTDAATEVSMGQALFTAVLQAAAILDVDLKEKGEHWRDIAENLPQPILAPAPEGVIEEAEGELVLQVGRFRGSAVPSRDLVAAGRSYEDGTIMFSGAFDPEGPMPRDWSKILPLMLNPVKAEPAYPYMVMSGQAFQGSAFCSVWPAEICGLADRDTAPFRAMVTTAKAYSPEIVGWEILPIVCARLGLAEEAMTSLEERPDRFQLYCNGFWRANNEDVTKFEGLAYFGVNTVLDASDPRSDFEEDEASWFDIAAWPFRHMETEPMGVMACTINEMLLQSYAPSTTSTGSGQAPRPTSGQLGEAGVIRIAPAYKWDAAFTLHAAGGFEVSAEIANGVPRWVGIKSLRGNRCEVANPWPGRDVTITEIGAATTHAGDHAVLGFATTSGGRYLLSPDADVVDSWQVEQRELRRNEGPKRSKAGTTMLGLQRMF